MDVKINDGNVCFGDKAVTFNMSYEDAKKILEDLIEIDNEPDKAGTGHMYIENTDFYNLKGSCTIYFTNNQLRQLDFHPMWEKYDSMDKTTGEEKEIYDEIKDIATESWNGLEEAFGVPYNTIGNRSKLFLTGGFRIDGIICRTFDFYTVSLKVPN